MANLTTNRKSISTKKIGNWEGKEPFYLKTKRKVERIKTLLNSEKNEKDRHIMDWMFLSKKVRRILKRGMLKTYHKKGSLSPRIFDGNPSNVKEFIDKKYSDIPLPVLLDIESMVINPVLCHCCRSYDNKPQALFLPKEMKRQKQ